MPKIIQLTAVRGYSTDFERNLNKMNRLSPKDKYKKSILKLQHNAHVVNFKYKTNKRLFTTSKTI